MNPDVILLGCFLVAVVALWLLSRIERRHKAAVDLYGEFLNGLQITEHHKLQELKTIRLYQGQRLLETRKLNANIRGKSNGDS